MKREVWDQLVWDLVCQAKEHKILNIIRKRWIAGVCGRGLVRVESVRARWAASCWGMLGEAGSEEAFCRRMKMGPEPSAAAEKALPI